MKRTLETTKRLVPTLTNPKPTFASLVRQGANQRAFHMTKSANPAMTEKEMAMTTKAAGEPAVKIHRILFAADAFANEDAVKGFLTSKGYSEFTVAAKDGGGFMVEDNPADAFKGDLRTVDHPTAKGVSFLVGEFPDADPAAGTAKSEGGTDPAEGAKDPAEGDDAAKIEAEEKAKAAAKAKEDEDAAKEAEAAKAAEEASKKAAPRVRQRPGLHVASKTMNKIVAEAEALGEFAETDAAKSSKTFADMLSNYTGGMPPGIYEMADAMVGELRRMIKSGDVDATKVSTLASDFTRGVMAVHAAFTSIMASPTAKALSPEALEGQLEALLNALFAAKATGGASAPGAEQDPVPALTKAQADELFAAVSEKMVAMQKAIDGVTLLVVEQGQTAEKSAKTEATAPGSRVLPERKSAEETSQGGKVADKSAEAMADDARRTAKRLGMNYPG